MFAKRLRTAAFSGGLWLSVLAAPALAEGLCNGTMSGSAMGPLPQPTTVTVVQPVSDDANPGLTQQFLNEVQAGGFTVMAAGQGNTQIDVTSTVTAGPGAGSGTFKGFGWMTGTQLPSGAASALSGSTISVSIEATNLTNQNLVWVGTIQCTVNTNDPGALSQHMGQLVARILGRSVQQRTS